MNSATLSTARTSAHEEGVQTRRPTVLVSLSAEERGWFFPHDAPGAGLEDRLEFRDSEAATPEAFHDEIARLKPEVILGAWRTPLLPVPGQGLPCRYYCHLAGAVRRTVPRELMTRGLLVSNWGASLSRYVAEAALALLLSALRNQTAHQFDMHLGKGWRNDAEVLFCRSLFNLRIGMHGHGAIAREFVPLVAPFSPRLQAFDPFADRTAAAQGVEFVDTLEGLFSENDAIVDFCALTEDTRGIVTESLLRRLPRGGVFVNVARGAIVDEDALARLVAEGHLKVGLDVFAREPLAADSPLRGMRQATLTPHTSGKAIGAHAIAGKFGMANLRRFLDGQALEGAVPLAQYDRMT